MPERADIWSYGGGVQSAAIACLVVDGRLPRPERIVMADTGREATATWDWLRQVIQPMLANVGLRVEVAHHSLATVDVYSTNGRPLIPAFVAGGGKLPTYCSVEWKRRVVHRWLRDAGYGPSRPVTEWLGISTDECHRAKQSDVDWVEFHYPLLLDAPMRRSECIQLVRDAHLGTPPRSRCVMCPHQSSADWWELLCRQNGDYEAAQAFEDEMHKHDPALFLRRECKRISEVRFADQQAQGAFDFCEEGRCEF
jgi:hypothetical protein